MLPSCHVHLYGYCADGKCRQGQTRNWNSETRMSGSTGNWCFVMQGRTTFTLSESKDLTNRLICHFCCLSLYAAQPLLASQNCAPWVRNSTCPKPSWHPGVAPPVGTTQMWEPGAYGLRGAVQRGAVWGSGSHSASADHQILRGQNSRVNIFIFVFCDAEPLKAGAGRLFLEGARE